MQYLHIIIVYHHYSDYSMLVYFFQASWPKAWPHRADSPAEPPWPRRRGTPSSPQKHRPGDPTEVQRCFHFFGGFSVCVCVNLLFFL